MNTRITLIEDHELFRLGLRHSLESGGSVEVVGEAGDYKSAIEALRETTPDIVVLDLMLPDADGFDLLRQIKEQTPEVKVLVLTAHQGQDWSDRAVQHGADGFIDKTSDFHTIAAAIQAIARGLKVVVPYPGTPATEASVRVDAAASTLCNSLSDREREVLERIARGLTNQQAADELFLSVKTVETYRSRLSRKLGVRNRSDMFKIARQAGLITD